MKKILVLLFVFTALLLFADQTQIVQYTDSWGEQGFSLEQSSDFGLQVNHSIEQFILGEENVEGELLRTVSLPGNILPNDEGMPNLPGNGRYIAIPQGSTAELRILDYRIETFHDIEVDKNGYIYIIGQFDQEMIIDAFYYDTYGLFESIWTGDYFLCKLDPDGNLVDLRRGSQNGENLIFRAIELDGNVEICLIGQTEGNQIFDFQFEPIEGHWRSFMVKLNSSFDAEWIISICVSKIGNTDCLFTFIFLIVIFILLFCFGLQLTNS